MFYTIESLIISGQSLVKKKKTAQKQKKNHEHLCENAAFVNMSAVHAMS